MKKYLALALVALMLVTVLAACGGTEATSTPASEAAPASEAPASSMAEEGGEEAEGEVMAYEFGAVVKTLANPFFKLVADGIEIGVADMGGTVTVYDCQNDVNIEQNVMNDLVAQGVDGIFLTANDRAGSVPGVQAALDAEIPVVIIDSSCDNGDQTVAVVMSDNVTAGALAMEGLAEAMGGEGKIVTYDNSTSDAVALRMEGRDAVLEEYPGIEVVNNQNGQGQVDKAMEVMNNFLQSDPEATGVWALNDPSAQGMIAAIKAAGRIDEYFVVGIDGAQESLDLIAAGEQLGTAAQFPSYLSIVGVEAMYTHLAGGTIEEQTILVETAWIDASNYELYDAADPSSLTA